MFAVLAPMGFKSHQMEIVVSSVKFRIVPFVQEIINVLLVLEISNFQPLRHPVLLALKFLGACLVVLIMFVLNAKLGIL